MTAFLQAYLLGWMFWLTLSLGCLGFLLLYQMTGGRWGKAVRPTLEAGAQVLPLWWALAIPIFWKLAILYPWARPDLQSNPLMQHKHVWLNTPFFYVRALIYFAAWSWMTTKLVSWGRASDANPSPRWDELRLRLGSVGMVVFFLTVAFAAMDWMMSLDPFYGSSMYGGIIIVGTGLTAMAFCAIMWNLQVRRAGGKNADDVYALHDVGNLLLAFTLLWTYTSIAQLLITWYGNLPEELGWYRVRSYGSWFYVSTLVGVGQFGLPFFVLLARPIKRQIHWLVWVALWILVMRFVELYWQIMPEFYPGGLVFSIWQILLPAALGGIWWVLYKRKAVS